jgi:hypothetical protein
MTYVKAIFIISVKSDQLVTVPPGPGNDKANPRVSQVINFLTTVSLTRTPGPGRNKLDTSGRLES